MTFVRWSSVDYLTLPQCFLNSSIFIAFWRFPSLFATLLLSSLLAGLRSWSVLHRCTVHRHESEIRLNVKVMNHTGWPIWFFARSLPQYLFWFRLTITVVIDLKDLYVFYLSLFHPAYRWLKMENARIPLQYFKTSAPILLFRKETSQSYCLKFLKNILQTENKNHGSFWEITSVKFPVKK